MGRWMVCLGAALAALAGTGCGGGHSAAPTGPTLQALVEGAAAAVRQAHPSAVLREATGWPSAGTPGQAMADLRRWVFVFDPTTDPAHASRAVAIEWNAGVYGSPIAVDLPPPAEAQGTIDAAPLVGLDEALRRAAEAGCPGPYSAVRYWKPLGASREEPVYALAVPKIGSSIHVGALSGVVSGVSMGGGPGPGDDGSALGVLFAEVLLKYPRAEWYSGVGQVEWDLSSSEPIPSVARWDLVFGNPGTEPPSTVTHSYQRGQWRAAPSLGARTTTGMTALPTDLTDPLTLWRQQVRTYAGVSMLQLSNKRFYSVEVAWPADELQPIYTYVFAAPRLKLHVAVWGQDVWVTAAPKP